MASNTLWPPKPCGRQDQAARRTSALGCWAPIPPHPSCARRHVSLHSALLQPILTPSFVAGVLGRVQPGLPEVWWEGWAAGAPPASCTVSISTSTSTPTPPPNQATSAAPSANQTMHQPATPATPTPPQSTSPQQRPTTTTTTTTATTTTTTTTITGVPMSGGAGQAPSEPSGQSCSLSRVFLQEYLDTLNTQASAASSNTSMAMGAASMAMAASLDKAPPGTAAA